jgi:hypothetical protein
MDGAFDVAADRQFFRDDVTFRAPSAITTVEAHTSPST